MTDDIGRKGKVPAPHVFIGILRDAFPTSASVFTTGACFELFKLLQQIYPNAEAWVDEDAGHIWTKIDSEFYDIYGKKDGGADGIKPLVLNPALWCEASNWKYKNGNYSDGAYL